MDLELDYGQIYTEIAVRLAAHMEINHTREGEEGMRRKYPINSGKFPRRLKWTLKLQMKKPFRPRNARNNK